MEINALMSQLLYQINYRNIHLTHDLRGETIPVRLKTGEYRYIYWLGFIAREEALQGGTPVKIKVTAYAEDELNPRWIFLNPGEHIQGCLLEKGVCAVINGSVPRVIKG